MYGFYVAILIVCDGFITLGLLTVWEYHYHNKNVVIGNPVKDCFSDHQHESLAIFIRQVMAVSSIGSFLIEAYSITFIQFPENSGSSAYQNTLKVQHALVE